MSGDRGPALVVDAPIDKHFEVLGRPGIVRVRIVEAVGHAGAVEGLLLDTVDEGGMRESGSVDDGGCDIDYMVELGADLATAVEAVGPVDDGAVPGATPM